LLLYLIYLKCELLIMKIVLYCVSRGWGVNFMLFTKAQPVSQIYFDSLK